MLSLALDVVDLWLVFYNEIQNEKLLAQYRTLLSDEERRQELRYLFADDRVRHLTTRALVRTVLSRYSDVRPKEWRFKRNLYGRPEIANEQRASNRISFNLSHTRSLVALGVTCHHALGVDTENMRAREVSLDLANRFFSFQEAAILQALPQEMQLERFFEYWTLKESYIKARGTGLTIPLDQLTFSFPGRSTIEVSFCAELCDTPSCWRFWQFKLCDYLLAVCVERSQAETQRLVMRRVIPLEGEELLLCSPLRKSE